jgi:hypothetical protein
MTERLSHEALSLSYAIDQYRRRHGLTIMEVAKFFADGCEDNGAWEFVFDTGSTSVVFIEEPERMNKCDSKRVEDGDWRRVGGGVICETCGLEYYDHPSVPGARWLNRLCDGRLVKL